MNNNENIKQMSITQIILYHLLPGVPILLLAILFANPNWGFGMSSFLALMFAIMFGLVPVQLFIIALTAKKQGVKFMDVISYTKKTPIIKFLLWTAPSFGVMGLAFMVLSNIEHNLWTNFTLMPDWFRLDKFVLEDHNINILRLTAVMNIVFNGLLGPIVEEFYFRGFLMPRMAKLGKSAPLVNSALFSLYHFFTPWEIITRIIGVTPLAYAVWYNKDIRIGIVLHCAGNLVGAISMAVAVFQM